MSWYSFQSSTADSDLSWFNFPSVCSGLLALQKHRGRECRLWKSLKSRLRTVSNKIWLWLQYIIKNAVQVLQFCSTNSFRALKPEHYFKLRIITASINNCLSSTSITVTVGETNVIRILILIIEYSKIILIKIQIVKFERSKYLTVIKKYGYFQPPLAAPDTENCQWMWETLMRLLLLQISNRFAT